MDIQVEHTVYNDLNYNDKGRFNSFWHQIDAALALKPKTIMEVGTGNGFVKFVLKKNNVAVSTIDIDPKLEPDILASVLSIPVGDNAFDVALCCQVLEHLPYENFVPALTEIRRVVSGHLILSLPDMHRAYRFNMQLPILGEIKFLWTLPRLKSQEWTFNGEHYWNISNKNYSVGRIRSDIEKAGFKIEKEFCVFEMSWHRFFILKKK
ncbi:Ubiquinone/menaquinone biosynthesis C-methylase UbiE [Chryseolinea serpens]|uniref:Ubiquinone/menaquinone biosynthesis C-methylase UbiE n=1 Tax=Chryseolinea serpens TaxID=947013 RepID=A0A1M5NS20_9BACT|nr:class I SAM-dependent methyltransferase [Chryseolinea serpens]SHG92268.1 Ubiquinone/menaquinone biosynthesis C-methylase UbiE [Chryseolinea serpens]